MSYDDSIGWTRLPGVLPPERAAEIAAACDALLDDDGFVPDIGDKPAGGTRRLCRVDDRIPGLEPVLTSTELLAVVAEIIGPDHTRTEVTYRCPGPGRGHQQLHADDVPRLDDGPYRGATVILPLVDFTVDNGPTRVLSGSHRRPDLQAAAARGETGHLEAEPIEAPAGSAIVFNCHLLHAGSENRSARPRPALQITYRVGPGRQPPVEQPGHGPGGAAGAEQTSGSGGPGPTAPGPTTP